MEKYTFRQPDNWHIHPREFKLQDLILHHFDLYGRALTMFNYANLIETADEALAEKDNLIKKGARYEPVPCIMLTENTTPQTIYDAARKGIRFVKFIPVGTSTGAVHGLRLDDIFRLLPILRAIAEMGMHLLIHAEYISFPNGVIIRKQYREEKAIQFLSFYRRLVPKLKITIEHVSTARMIHFVIKHRLLATLTPQHALMGYRQAYNRQGYLINPYNHCLPCLKKEKDRQAVEWAMVSGIPLFFSGTDAAAHWMYKKEGKNPPPGIFFGMNEFLRGLDIFERNNALHKVNDFYSRFGAENYGFPLNTGTITVVKEKWNPPISENGIRFCMGGEPVGWKIEKVNH
jgi:dihydroorotase